MYFDPEYSLLKNLLFNAFDGVSNISETLEGLTPQARQKKEERKKIESIHRGIYYAKQFCDTKANELQHAIQETPSFEETDLIRGLDQLLTSAEEADGLREREIRWTSDDFFAKDPWKTVGEDQAQEFTKAEKKSVELIQHWALKDDANFETIQEKYSQLYEAVELYQDECIKQKLRRVIGMS